MATYTEKIDKKISMFKELLITLKCMDIVSFEFNVISMRFFGQLPATKRYLYQHDEKLSIELIPQNKHLLIEVKYKENGRELVVLPIRVQWLKRNMRLVPSQLVAIISLVNRGGCES